jgi:dUTP pyrophosphatase
MMDNKKILENEEEVEKELEELENLNKLIDEITSSLDTPKNNSLPIDEHNNLISNYEAIKDKFNVITKFTNSSNNVDPEYSREGDSGFDLRAYLSESVTLKSLERKVIPTGLRFELSSNTELQVRPRSGMALKHGITVLNTPGTVDEGYRGEVGVIAINLSNEDYTIEPGDRIAQGVIMNVVGQRISKLIKTETLSETERGEGGFGSTGKE